MPQKQPLPQRKEEIVLAEEQPLQQAEKEKLMQQEQLQQLEEETLMPQEQQLEKEKLVPQEQFIIGQSVVVYWKEKKKKWFRAVIKGQVMPVRINLFYNYM